MSFDRPTLTITRLHRALEHAGAGLTMQQYRVLALLSVGDARASDVARRLAVTKPTVTSLADSLIERGMVIRETEGGDRRAVTLSITADGRDAIADTAARLRDVLDDVVSRCGDPGAVYAALTQLETAVDEWWEARRNGTVISS